ncbi:MAG: hypothetical protein AAFW89_04465 [Bacteroidota bacterium]
MCRLTFFLLFLVIGIECIHAQVYVEKKTRHRFAQLTVGLDIQRSIGGTSRFARVDNTLRDVSLDAIYRPRFVIGGTHFWGHADFYIAIELGNQTSVNGDFETQFTSGVETVFKAYPWRIEQKKIRPYAGLAYVSYFYEQSQTNATPDPEFGNRFNGPELNRIALPLVGGITYQYKNRLIDLGFLWDYRNEQSYFVTPNLQATSIMPPLYVHVSYRWLFDTTLSAERNWENGTAQQRTKQLLKEGRLNRFFVGAGLSSVFWLTESPVNPDYVGGYSPSILPDLSAGYYMAGMDANVALSYRPYQTSTTSFDISQTLRRRSFGGEITKFLFDYNGFAPFIGPALTYDWLEADDSRFTSTVSEQRFVGGVTFGWDIRPNRLQGFVLRTNLRWFPRARLDAPNGSDYAFDALEFNFIQAVWFFGR